MNWCEAKRDLRAKMGKIRINYFALCDDLILISPIGIQMLGLINLPKEIGKISIINETKF